MKRVSGRQMCKALERKGWSCVRVKGSHHQHAHDDRPGVIVTVPVHDNKTPKAGTQRTIMRQAGRSEDDL